MKLIVVLFAIASELAAAAPAVRRQFVRALAPEQRRALYVKLRYEWPLWCRSEQRAPEEPWRYWFLISGRAGGKTRPAAELVNGWAKDSPGIRILLAGSDAGNCRKVMVDGESGILASSPPWFRPHYYPTLKRLVWPNGTIGETHSAEEPKAFRGHQYHKAWVEELFHWPVPPKGTEPIAWKEGVLACVRLGQHPQTVITSTPRQTTFCEDLLLGKRDAKGRRPIADKELLYGTKPASWTHDFDIEVDGERLRIRAVVSRWSTERNRSNLSPGYAEDLRRQFRGSRLEQQELDGIILARVEGALWDTESLDEERVLGLPRILRTLVSVDPTRADSPTDEAGIIVGGLGNDEDAYVWDDCTVKGSISEWGKAAIQAHHRYNADAIVYETNRLSEQDRRFLRSLDRSVKWMGVRATADKFTRAQPIAGCYKEGRVHHVRGARDPHVLDFLEDEMTCWDPKTAVRSPNRLDALVWLITALLLGDQKQPLQLV